MLSVSSIKLAVVVIVPILLAFCMIISRLNRKDLPLACIIKNSPLLKRDLGLKPLDPLNRRFQGPAMPKTPVYFFSHGGVSKQRWTENNPARILLNIPDLYGFP